MQAKECSCVTKDTRKFDLRPKLDYAIKSCANWPQERDQQDKYVQSTIVEHIQSYVQNTCVNKGRYLKCGMHIWLYWGIM